MKFTKPQMDALRLLADGEEHETWRRATSKPGETVLRVNHLAAGSLGDLRLVRYRFSAGGTAYVRITDAGRAALAQADREAFDAWLAEGQERAWVEGYCSTHDLGPMTTEEKRVFEDGGDPCIPALRVWLEP